MGYVVTLHRRAAGSPALLVAQRREVEEIDEAQEVAAEIVGDLCHAFYESPGRDWTGRKAKVEELVTQAFMLGEDGGEVGPLPGGEMVKVARSER